MEEGDAVLGEQLLHLAEEDRVMHDADMLEHADGDDPIVTAGGLAVVAKLEAHAIGKPGIGGAALRQLELLARQGEPGDGDAAFAGEIERKAAPAAADIEHSLPGLQQQLRRDVALLVGLRHLDALVGRQKIGAGILPVGIEEEIVERVRKVVVMRDIGARAPQRIVLLENAEGAAETLIERRQRRARREAEVDGGEIQEVVDAGVFDRQRPIHERLADIEARIEEQLVAERGVVQPDGNVGTGLAGKAMDRAMRIDDAQCPLAHEVTE